MNEKKHKACILLDERTMIRSVRLTQKRVQKSHLVASHINHAGMGGKVDGKVREQPNNHHGEGSGLLLHRRKVLGWLKVTG